MNQIRPDQVEGAPSSALGAVGETAPAALAAPSRWKPKSLLILGTLAVVYGDIGTSPLYALRECFVGQHAAALTPLNVLGILSLFFWSLLLVVSVKYLSVVFQADNHGEGGILALLALNRRAGKGLGSRKPEKVAVALGLIGAGLLYGDGVITPAISVLSAVEGLETIAPTLQPVIVPLTVLILLALFLIQKRGTGGVGVLFGPFIALWFFTIAGVGLPWIFREPAVLLALNPYYAVLFFVHNGLAGFLVLGAVVLCITGAEALYADMGHFGKRPIHLTWYGIVMPSLLINYFAQGALLLQQGQSALRNPFFGLAPGPLLIPLVIISTIATVIASQALISGAFSLTHQAIQLGYLPRMHVIHTSSIQEGQIYLPQVNAFLMVLSVTLVLAFQESSRLAGIYGIAVIGTMTITSMLFFFPARTHLGWSTPKAVVVVAGFLLVDLSFMFANVTKVAAGGWVPILLAAVVFTIMTTWNLGIRTLLNKIRAGSIPLAQFAKEAQSHFIHRVRGTSIFLTANVGITPGALAHHFKHNQVLHETVVVLSVVNEPVPKVPPDQLLEIGYLGGGFYQVQVHIGFMESADIPDVLARCARAGVPVDPARSSYFVGRETIVLSDRPGISAWRKHLFLFLFTNARSITPSFKLPPNRVIEIGAEIEI